MEFEITEHRERSFLDNMKPTKVNNPAVKAPIKKVIPTVKISADNEKIIDKNEVISETTLPPIKEKPTNKVAPRETPVKKINQVISEDKKSNPQAKQEEEDEEDDEEDGDEEEEKKEGINGYLLVGVSVLGLLSQIFVK